MKLVGQAKYLSTTKGRITLLLIVVLLLLFRYDFYYNLPNYSVSPKDSFWKIFSQKLYKNARIARVSIDYLRTNYSDINWDHIEKNNTGNDGYKISVWFNKLTIQKPNHKYLVRNVAILPKQMLSNHTMQVISYDLVVFSIFFFLYVSLVNNNFKISKGLFKNFVLTPTLIILSGLAVIVAIYLLLVFRNLF